MAQSDTPKTERTPKKAKRSGRSRSLSGSMSGSKSGPAKDISMAVREVCLSFPQTEEVMSHGSPDFRVINGKVFATYAINHHGDGHLALWLRSPPGAQSMYVDGEPEYFYVPPYVGPAGWLGVDLDKGLSWDRIADLVQEAYVEVAPKKLTHDLGPAIRIEPPDFTIDPEEFDPFNAPHAEFKLGEISAFVNQLPEVTPDRQFGSPCFRAGKKNFCTVYFRQGRMRLSVWAGEEGQATLTFDERYTVPPYTGRNGWLDLDIQDELLMDEARPLVETSYRHFALKRMLKALDAE